MKSNRSDVPCTSKFNSLKAIGELKSAVNRQPRLPPRGLVDRFVLPCVHSLPYKLLKIDTSMGFCDFWHLKISVSMSLCNFWNPKIKIFISPFDKIAYRDPWRWSKSCTEAIGRHSAGMGTFFIQIRLKVFEHLKSWRWIFDNFSFSYAIFQKCQYTKNLSGILSDIAVRR